MNLVLSWVGIKKSGVAAKVCERLSAFLRHIHHPPNHLRQTFMMKGTSSDLWEKLKSNPTSLGAR